MLRRRCVTDNAVALSRCFNAQSCSFCGSFVPNEHPGDVLRMQTIELPRFTISGAAPVPLALDAAVLPKNEFDTTGAISPATLEELQIIAQVVAQDLGLKVQVGSPGEGSYFSFDPPLITLDPWQILSDLPGAKFVAGHEGAHRRFSPSPLEMLGSPAAIEARYGQLGFHATMNTIEDCAVNDGMARDLPGMRALTTQHYARADARGMQISTPEIEAIAQRLGREPSFVRALAEMTRDWHRWRKESGYLESFDRVAKEGRYAEGLPRSVLQALRVTRRAVRTAIAQLPVSSVLDEETRIQFGRRRCQIVWEEVYPEIKRLLEEDVRIESVRQFLQESALGDGAGSKGGEGKISSRARKEIEQAAEEFAREQAHSQLQQFQEITQRIAEEQRLQEQLSDSQNASLSGDPSIGKPNAEELARDQCISKVREAELQRERATRFPKLEELSQSGKSLTEKELEDKLVDEMAGAKRHTADQPLAYDRLSPQTQRELRRAFEALSKDEQERLTRLAEEQLAALEHEIVQALRAKLDPEPIETLHERTQREDREAQQHEEFRQQLERLSDVQQQLEEQRVASLEPFDRVFEEIAPAVQSAVQRLQRVLIPEAFFTWRKDQQTGSRLNLQRALQSEADPRFLTKLFEQRQDPTRRTHAVEVLVDTSDSMRGEKCACTFEGVVFVTAVLEALGVAHEIIEFNDTSTIRKHWQDSIKDEAVRKKIAEASYAKDLGTSDAPAIHNAHRRLVSRRATYKFLLVLTDAQSSVSSELLRELRRVQRRGEVVVVHFGVGTGTRDTNGYYKHSFGDLLPNTFFEKFCEVVEEIILHPEQYRTADADLDTDQEESKGDDYDHE